jgi:hypothetical protein
VGGDSNSRPSLRQAILYVLNERADAMRPTDIFKELELRGWAPKGKNARGQLHARLSKMVANRQVIRRGDAGSGRYTLPSKTEGPGSPSAL